MIFAVSRGLAFLPSSSPSSSLLPLAASKSTLLSVVEEEASAAVFEMPLSLSGIFISLQNEKL